MKGSKARTFFSILLAPLIVAIACVFGLAAIFSNIPRILNRIRESNGDFFSSFTPEERLVYRHFFKGFISVIGLFGLGLLTWLYRGN